jgi:glycosyltransferase involved in cell wall biosynthesis
VNKQISIIIPVQPGCKVQSDLSNSPLNSEVIIVRNSGVGFARSIGASAAKGDLLVMLDSDLVLSPDLWSWILKLQKGTFAMAKNPERASYSTKVFAIHKEDYLEVGGFNPSLKYLWEDGEFALRASSRGLKVTPVPSNMYKHIEHESRCRNKDFFIFFNWEYARLFVKFRRIIYPNLAMWFFDMLNLRKQQFNLQPIMVRVSGFFFWNFKSLISNI